MADVFFGLLCASAGAMIATVVCNKLGKYKNVECAAESVAHHSPRLRLESSLHTALDRNEFVLHYQPQVDIATGQMIGVEALLRWESPQYGTISPEVFIPIAERTGIIVPIGEWVFRQACRKNREWLDAGYPTIKTSINLSSLQLQHPDTLHMIHRVLRETNCDPQYITVELTETTLMKDLSMTTTLEQISQMGLEVAIDDFGTGYSSLAYLKRFPIHVLKLDKSFMDDLFRDDEDAIVRAVLNMAHGMNMKVVAEGVETLEQLEFLKKHSCDVMQGFYFSRPVSHEQIEALLAGLATQSALNRRDGHV